MAGDPWGEPRPRPLAGWFADHPILFNIALVIGTFGLVVVGFAFAMFESLIS